MKLFFKFLVLAIICFASIDSFAQDGLKFSKTFIIEVPKDGYAFTVPEGKIWRVEAAGGTGFNLIWLQNQAGESMFYLGISPGLSGGNIQSHFNLASNFSGKFYMSVQTKGAKGFVSITEYTIP